jgi:small conductance mechanosensitive channel
MGWQRANVDVLLPLDADLQRALDLMRGECEAMAQDPAWANDIVEPPQVLGVNDMNADGLTIRITARTAPGRQDAFARELRARIATRLVTEGISLAKPPAEAAPAPAASSSDTDE